MTGNNPVIQMYAAASSPCVSCHCLDRAAGGLPPLSLQRADCCTVPDINIVLSLFTPYLRGGLNATRISCMHAEPPATCHQSAFEDVEAFRQCAPEAVVYTAPAGAEGGNGTAAVWTAAEDVVLDARYLFRGIHLQRDLEIRGMTVAQVSHRSSPRPALVAGIPSCLLSVQSCLCICAVVFPAIICQLARKTGKAFQKGAACLHAEAG